LKVDGFVREMARKITKAWMGGFRPSARATCRSENSYG